MTQPTCTERLPLFSEARRLDRPEGRARRSLSRGSWYWVPALSRRLGTVWFRERVAELPISGDKNLLLAAFPSTTRENSSPLQKEVVADQVQTFYLTYSEF